MPAAASSSVIDQASTGVGWTPGCSIALTPIAASTRAVSGGEHVALAAGVVGDDDTTAGGPVGNRCRAPSARRLPPPAGRPAGSCASTLRRRPPGARRCRSGADREAVLEVGGIAGNGPIDRGRPVRRGCRRRARGRARGRRCGSGRGASVDGTRSQPVGEPPQLDQRPRPDVADHLGGGDRPETTAVGERSIRGQPVQEPRGEQIARTGGVDDSLDRHGGHGLDARRR